MGKSIKTKAAEAVPDTLVSQATPGPGDAAPEAVGASDGPSPLALEARSSERLISNADSSEGQARCLARREVVAYLGPSCSKALRARVDGHVAACAACRRWIRHVDDEILEYVGGQRSEDELRRMDAHLDACPACRGLMHHVLQGMAKSWHGEERDMPDSSTTFAPGNVVNSRYLIRSFVGRGGMGEVYEAYDRLMDRRIALKTMLCTVADRPRAARRFKEEVRNAQRVGHPHVCRINDLQEHHESVFGPPLPFFTMEFIDGERLGNYLLNRALPLADVRVLALQLLDGLRVAHQRGVLHLDLKSDNVMLRRNPEGPDAVIMDFGLSRVLGNESRLRTSDRRQFAGTLPYMSVEQLECREDLGPATDIYAFGVVLYEMLTRTLPFTGDSLSAVLLKQLNERPTPPSRHVPELGPRLERFVLKCLSSHPSARYADAGEALRALESIGPWSRQRGRELLRRAAVPALAISVVGALLFTSAPRQSPPATAPGAAATPNLEQLTRELAPDPAPEARQLAAPAPVAASEAAAPSAEGALPAPPTAGVVKASGQALVRRPSPLQHGDRTPGALLAPSTAPAQAGPIDPSGRAVTPDMARDGAPAVDGAGWKPSKVPKRLSSPSGSVRPGHEFDTEHQKLR